MAVSQFSAAYVQHAAQAGQLRLQKPAAIHAPTGRAEYLLRELKQAFVGKAGKSHGGFAEEDAPLKPWLAELIEAKLGFSGLCDKLWQHLETTLAGTSADLDAHLLVFIESLAEGDFCHLFLLDHKEGLYLDSDLALADSLYLDISKLLGGARINISEAMSASADDIDPPSYIALLKPRGDKELADVFAAFVGSGEPRDSKAETETFLEAVAEFTHTMEEQQAQQCRHEVVEFCLGQDKLGAPVEFEELSSALVEAKAVEDEHSFAEFVNAFQQRRDLAKTAALIPDRSKLRQFLRLSGRSDQMSVSFNADCLGDAIVYNAEEGSLTIKSIPSALKLRLLQHIQGDD
ncbi:MAG: nucleoid-associated protein [Cellvibrionaceae bacterium]|nr:nucleoid-associated protein [Cellvibrionaceae bacterium]